MSWTYDDTLKTSKDIVRFTTGDTEINMPLLQDGEIEFALVQTEDNIQAASVMCCRAILAKTAKLVKQNLGGNIGINAEQRYAHYKDLLIELQRNTIQTYGAPVADVDPSRPSSFDIGMHDA